MAYAQPSDVEARLGRSLDGSESTIVAARLDDAELKLRTRISDLDDKVAASATYEQAVVMVEADMVLRLIRNPEGYTQETDGNYSYMISSAVASGRLDVLDDEWQLLGIRRAVYMVSVLPKMPWSTA